LTIRIPYLLAALIAAAAVMNTNAEKGVSAATSLSIKSIDGHTFDINRPDSKATLLSFWSTSCSICLRDVPVLNALHDEFDRADLAVLAVSMQYDTPHEIRSFADSQSIRYAVSHDEKGEIAAAFPGVRFTPTSFLLDEKGSILWRHTGRLDQATVTQELTAVLSDVQLAER
jgi:peroxiredoxin